MHRKRFCPRGSIFTDRLFFHTWPRCKRMRPHVVLLIGLTSHAPFVAFDHSPHATMLHTFLRHIKEWCSAVVYSSLPLVARHRGPITLLLPALHQSAGNKQLAKTRSFNFPHKVIFFVEPSTLIGFQMNIFPLKNNVIADTPY